MQALLFFVSFVLFGSVNTNAQNLANLTDRDVSETILTFKTDNPAESAKVFGATMPQPVNAKIKETVLNNLPKQLVDKQIPDFELSAKVRQLILPALAFYKREDIYRIYVIKHPSRFVALDTGTALFISSGFLADAESDDEVIGAVAHEIGHEYFGEYSIVTKHMLGITKVRRSPAIDRRLMDVLMLVELECDAFASITLTHLGSDPMAFIEGIERITAKQPNESAGHHPKVEFRRAVVKGVVPNSGNRRKTSLLLRGIQETVAQKVVRFEPVSQP